MPAVEVVGEVGQGLGNLAQSRPLCALALYPRSFSFLLMKYLTARKLVLKCSLTVPASCPLAFCVLH